MLENFLKEVVSIIVGKNSELIADLLNSKKHVNEFLIAKKLTYIYNQIRSRETKEFYICERCHIEVSEEHALLNNFTCNECGDIFARKDNTKILKEMKRQAEKIENEIKLIDEEITKEKEKLGKIRVSETQKEEKIKKETKRKKALERKKAKKTLKKSKPKKSKKKIKKIRKIIRTIKKAIRKKSKSRKKR